MSRRRYIYTPSTNTEPLPELCIAERCQNEALSWSRCCETHYQDASRWKQHPERLKHWGGLNVTPAYVYFVQAGGFIKIGRTRQGVEQRVSDARTFCPMEITVLACVSTMHWVEPALHAALAAHRERGEWFRAHADVLRVVDIARAGAPGIEAYARPFAKTLKGTKPPKSKFSVLSKSR